MTGLPRKAAIYARISSDDGTALGVARQVEDCRRLAESLGWAVAEEYVDNDVSAFSGKRRPAYERMMEDLADGSRDAVVGYHPDRLTRRPIELEQFVDTVTAAGVRHVRFVAGGPVNVADGDSLLVLRIQGAVAANESASKSRRVRRKMDEVAASGRPHGGAFRPFGYEADKVTVRPDEADTIRALVARYLAGESLRSLAAWLDSQGVRTVAGGPWTTTTVRSVISSARIAGLREHRGEVVGPASWEAIITPAERDKVLTRLASFKNAGRRTPRRYLLSGLLRCERCGHRLYASARATSRRYVCQSGPDHGGCGRMTVAAEPVEELIAEAVLYRLDTPELADALAGRAAEDEQAAALAESLAADKARLDELAALYGEGQIGSREWLAARHPIEARIADTERRLARMTHSDALTGLVGNSVELRSRWTALGLTRQAAIVAAVLDHAVVHPVDPHASRKFDPARVEPVWKL
jgi:DNA invertase Pin-like site-specific DNA recombinase